MIGKIKIIYGKFITLNELNAKLIILQYCCNVLCCFMRDFLNLLHENSSLVIINSSILTAMN